MGKIYHKFDITGNTCMTCGVQRRNPGNIKTIFEYSNDEGVTYQSAYINCFKKAKYEENTIDSDRHSWEKIGFGSQWRCKHCGAIRNYSSIHGYTYLIAKGNKTVTVTEYVKCITKRDDSEFYE